LPAFFASGIATEADVDEVETEEAVVLGGCGFEATDVAAEETSAAAAAAAADAAAAAAGRRKADEARVAVEAKKHVLAIARQTEQAFPVQTVFESVGVLVEAANELASRLGFVVSRRGASVVCSRGERGSDGRKMKAKATDVPESKRRKTNSLRCGCEWALRFAQLNWKDKECKKVKVTCVFPMHTNGCAPSATQQVIASKRSGQYTTNVPRQKLVELISFLNGPAHIPARLLREMARPCFPAASSITAQDLFNLRLKAKRIGDDVARSGELLRLEKNKVGFEFEGLDNSAPLCADDATVNAAELLRLALLDGGSGWMVVSYLEKLKEVSLTVAVLRCLWRVSSVCVQRSRRLRPNKSVQTESVFAWARALRPDGACHTE